MNEKKIARNALPCSSRPTFGPTASVRTILYWSAPRPPLSAESTASAVACVLPSVVTPPAPSRARITYSLAAPNCWIRSEEHTSELQSRLHLVCRLLLEKKKHSLISPLVTHT